MIITKKIYTMKSVEIMSPVGSYEALLGAMQGGADSVYFGVGKLNMRSKSANNFGLEDLVNIASFCNEHGIKSYLTVNTVIYNDEIEEMHTLVSTAKESGVSAVIASDMAVISYARSIGMEVHISTQCNISNYEAVKYYSKFADVMVTARELSLRQVAEITEYIAQNDIRGPKGELVEIEVFAHGALCMAVSGKCYLSLDNYNHSANRGECLQLCRRQYKVSDLESDIELVVDNKYIMSPKDLCTLPFIDKVLKAGVRVLKIEGRGRSAEYVKTVTRCYKEAAQAHSSSTKHRTKLYTEGRKQHARRNRCAERIIEKCPK
jgi:putative protease